MTPALAALFDAAKAAQGKAYAPYSRYRVGVAIRSVSGAVYAGCNVENAAYPVGTCAEAGAIAAMILAGERDILEVCVVGDGPELCTPCGACRQRLREFAASTAKIHCGNGEKIVKSLTLGQLLPHSFGPDHLT